MTNTAPRPPDGLTLRDYFAAAALAGCMDRYSLADWTRESYEQHVAEQAYRQADAMLAARIGGPAKPQ